MVQCSFTSTETRRLVRVDSPGRPPRLSHSSVLCADSDFCVVFMMLCLNRSYWAETVHCGNWASHTMRVKSSNSHVQVSRVEMRLKGLHTHALEPMYTYTVTYIHLRAHKRTLMYMHAGAHTHTHTHTHTRTRTHARTNAHTRTRTHARTSLSLSFPTKFLIVLFNHWSRKKNSLQDSSLSFSIIGQVHFFPRNSSWSFSLIAHVPCAWLATAK